MRYILLLAAFLALASPAHAGDPEVHLGTTVAIGPALIGHKPVDGSPTSLYVSAVGMPGERQQAIAGYFEAWSANDGPQGPADTVAVFGQAWSANANGYAVGGYLEAHAVHPSGKGAGAEIRSGNFSASHALYTPSYASRLMGLWITTAGMDSSAAIQVGNIPPSRWKVGLGFTAGSVADTSIRDDSSSTTSIDIRGVHEAAIRVARGAGKVVFDAPVWINGKLIEVGAQDTCGVGYRCLRVRN